MVWRQSQWFRVIPNLKRDTSHTNRMMNPERLNDALVSLCHLTQREVRSTVDDGRVALRRAAPRTSPLPQIPMTPRQESSPCPCPPGFHPIPTEARSDSGGNCGRRACHRVGLLSHPRAPRLWKTAFSINKDARPTPLLMVSPIT
jgi:hypothetical protein